MDMWFYLVWYRVKQKQFDVFLKNGVKNLRDCFTKHHSPKYQNVMIPVYLQYPNARQASEVGCYYKSPLNMNQGKPTRTGGYNNTE